MTSMAPVPAGPAALGRPANGGYVARSIAWTILAVVSSLTNLVYSPLGAAEPGLLLVLVAFPAAFAVPVLLWWRRRAPIAVTLLAALLGIALPIGAVTAWIALVATFKRRGGAPVWWATLAVVGATAAAVLRDLWLPSGAGLLGGLVQSVSETGPSPSAAGGEPWLGELPWYVPVAVVAVMMAFVVGTGLLTRAVTRTRRAEARSAAAGARTAELGGALARQQEREQIAREVHDGLGQRLSIVAMHAGALSVSPGLNEEARGTAELLRASAAEAADDLRSLLRVLRQNEELPPVPLHRLEGLIADFERAGLPVRARVSIVRPDEAPAPLARAVVRIVQELLTNARKHAGGELLHLHVGGGPPGPTGPGGIVMQAQNLLPAVGTTPARPSGYGLQGIAERVERLGGRLRYGLDPSATTFVTEVRLPWAVGPVERGRPATPEPVRPASA